MITTHEQQILAQFVSAAKGWPGGDESTSALNTRRAMVEAQLRQRGTGGARQGGRQPPGAAAAAAGAEQGEDLPNPLTLQAVSTVFRRRWAMPMTIAVLCLAGAAATPRWPARMRGRRRRPAHRRCLPSPRAACGHRGHVRGRACAGTTAATLARGPRHRIQPQSVRLRAPTLLACSLTPAPCVPRRPTALPRSAYIRAVRRPKRPRQRGGALQLS